MLKITRTEDSIVIEGLVETLIPILQALKGGVDLSPSTLTLSSEPKKNGRAPKLPKPKPTPLPDDLLADDADVTALATEIPFDDDDATEPTPGVKDEPAPKPAKATATATAPKVKKKAKVSIAEVMGLSTKLVRGKKEAELRAVLEKMGIDRPKNLPEDRWDEFMTLAGEIEL